MSLILVIIFGILLIVAAIMVSSLFGLILDKVKS
jgi:hypothetical protein